MLKKQLGIYTPNTLLFTFLLILLAFQTEKVKCQDTPNDHNIQNDTVWVYDTSFVYDTLWVYDTIWIYDTVLITTENSNELLPGLKVAPVTVAHIENNVSPTALALTSETFCLGKSEAKKQDKDPLSGFGLPKINFPQVNWPLSKSQRLTVRHPKGKFNPKAFFSGNLSAELTWGPEIPITRYKFTEGNDTSQKTLKDVLGWNFGARLNYNVLQVSLGTGAYVSILKESFSYSKDTIIIDSTQSALNYYSEIKHVRLEVPLLLAYQWKFHKTGLRVTIGEVNQFHLLSKGYSVNPNNKVTDINSTTQFTRYNIALFGAIGLSYNIHPNIDIGMDAYYKYPFKQFSSTYHASAYKQTYGISCMIRYRFQHNK